MRSHPGHLAVAALVLTATAATAQAQRGTPDPERAAARQVIVEMATHIQGGNWLSADSLFAARGVHVLVDTTAYHSWADYRDKSLKPELARYGTLTFANSRVEAQIRGTVAWIAFRQEISGTAASGPAQKVARGSAVLEKRDGRWTIVHYHVSR